MSDLEDLGLYSEGEKPMDTIDSEDNVFEDVLEEETDSRVNLSQSDSDLLSESKGVKVSCESLNKHPKQEKSDRVHKIPGSQSQDRGLTVSLKPRS